MEAPKLHPQEAQRLQILKELEILDTPIEKSYEHIAFLASQICETPIAVISLVDKNRQWFKAKIGLGADETSRDVSFCGHAILQEPVFEVEDAHLDSRFKDNPLVTGNPNIAFYCGAQIKDTGSKLPLGTVCVIDQKPKKLSSEQKEALKALAHQVEILFEIRNQTKILIEKNKALEMHQTIFHSMSEGVVVQGPSGAIIEANPSACRILCMTKDQMMGKTSMDPDWYSIKENGKPFPGEEHPAMVTLKTGRALSNVTMGVGNKTKSRWISINSTPLKDENGSVTHALTTFSDITELKDSQTQLVEKARIASVGEMAAGIAHEINNPLAVIEGLLIQIERKSNKNELDKEKLHSHIGNIRTTVHRISSIVKSLLKLSRDGKKDPPSKVNLAKNIDEILLLAKERVANQGIELQISIDPGLNVEANQTYLSQVILNLINNSIDALEDNPEKWIKIQAVANEKTISISFTDSGKGIPAEILENIFNPFFTTKVSGKGTGLGLSISQKLVREMGGSLKVNKESPNTSFVIELNKF